MEQGKAFEVLAIVPARGGSKGLERKNIRSLGGRPLLSYVVEAARAAETVDRVVVSTEDPEIAEVAIRCGAEVPFLRPNRLAGDRTHLQAVVDHLIDTLAAQEGYRPDIHVTILPTFPFVASSDIDGVVRECCEGALSAFSAKRWRHDFDSLFVARDDRLIGLLDSEGDPPPPAEARGDGALIGPLSITASHAIPAGARRSDGIDAARAYLRSLMDRGLIHRYPGELRVPIRCHVIDDPIAWIDVDTEQDLSLAQTVLEKRRFTPPLPKTGGTMPST